MAVNTVTNTQPTLQTAETLSFDKRQLDITTTDALFENNVYGSQFKLQTLEFQGTYNRNNLLLAQAEVNNKANSVYKNSSITIDDPIVGKFKFGERTVTGPFNAPATNPAAPARDDTAAIDAGHNGNAYRITAPNANENANPVIFVNGINTDVQGARRTAAEISRLTGAPVDLAYNASSVNVALDKTLDHFRVQARAEAEAAAPSWLSGDLRESWVNADTNRRLAIAATDPETAEWAKENTLHNPETAQTTANLILEQLKSTDGPVNVVAYSQGGAITADALRRLENQGVDLSRVRVLAVGAAADRDDFPAGVRVSSFAHENDGISQYFGENRGDFSLLEANNLRDTTQHTNYFRGQGGGNPADPNAERLLRHWYNGNTFAFQELADVQPR